MEIPSNGRRLFFGIGGAEHNANVLYYLVNSIWRCEGTKEFSSEIGLNENAFMSNNQSLTLGCEHLAHGVDRKHHKETTERLDNSKYVLAAHIFKLVDVEDKTDLVCVYGYNAISSQVFSLLTAFVLRNKGDGEMKVPIKIDISPHLYIIKKRGFYKH
jgi:hypothetical protein